MAVYAERQVSPIWPQGAARTVPVIFPMPHASILSFDLPQIDLTKAAMRWTAVFIWAIDVA